MPRSVSGFSLLEMLLVLFVVVVLTSLVSLNVGSGADTRLREQAALSIRDGVVFALDEAQFTGRDFGLLLQAGTGVDPGVQLRWRERLAQGWRGPANNAVVFEDLWLDGDVELILDGLLVEPVDPAEGDALAGSVPQWLFLASGDTQTGQLLWRDSVSGEMLFRLEWDALGRVEVFRGDELDSLAAAP